MICAENYETVFKFVKVMPRILVASFFQTRCIAMIFKKMHVVAYLGLRSKHIGLPDLYFELSLSAFCPQRHDRLV